MPKTPRKPSTNPMSLAFVPENFIPSLLTHLSGSNTLERRSSGDLKLMSSAAVGFRLSLLRFLTVSLLSGRSEFAQGPFKCLGGFHISAIITRNGAHFAVHHLQSALCWRCGRGRSRCRTCGANASHKLRPIHAKETYHSAERFDYPPVKSFILTIHT